MLRDRLVGRLGLSGRREALRLWSDERAFRRLEAPVAPAFDAWRVAKELLEPSYERYVTDVSDRQFAASLETCAFLYCLCVELEVTSILDLGTGFTSYVFRRFARERGGSARVVSVDHDSGWLGRTSAYLESAGCDRRDLLTLADFDASMPGVRFGLIFNDLWGPLRSSLSLGVVDRLAPGGAIVVDDANRVDDRRAFMGAARSRGLRLYDVRPWTRDAFGRWALLAM